MFQQQQQQQQQEVADPPVMEVLAPQLERLLNFNGASWVTIADVEFKHAAIADRVNQYHSSVSAITVSHSAHITFERVSVSLSGNNGWMLGICNIILCSSTK